jgi:hypothetical protein
LSLALTRGNGRSPSDCLAIYLVLRLESFAGAATVAASAKVTAYRSLASFYCPELMLWEAIAGRRSQYDRCTQARLPTFFLHCQSWRPWATADY